ncbi:baseplate J/gp47 family protein [Alicyclobacillus tolerans]|uniref:baseplate J/gp47 family protein n=1 Tax=Alicyclobacillus tolerans TaxID=90970 RepID=UPI001F230A50|nr:baseplate J/gp47 family protein [Alicyclobacillus tolerans]MCF8566920.1 baseplate J/gp47 family protein [Alicyclobacillus tolerans]
MFSTALQTMISSIQTGLAAISKKLTDYSSNSVIGVILAAIASAIDELNTAISTAQLQAYLKTATGTNLDNKAADFGIVRKQATAAQWVFVATKQVVSAQAITIPAGSLATTVPTSTQDAITYTVNADTVLPIGSTTVNINVTCTQAGSIGNIATGTQLLWGSAVPGIDGVEFDSTTGGIAGIDTETDDQLRARALAAFQGLSISTQAWYQSTAEGVTGVSSALVVPQGRGPGTVDIYIVGQNNTVPDTTLISSVQSVIDAGRVITDDAKVFAPSPVTVNGAMTITTATGYDHTAVATQVQTNLVNYINGLGIGGGSTNLLPAAQWVAIAMGTAGVENASTTFTDTTFTSDQLPQAGTITVT